MLAVNHNVSNIDPPLALTLEINGDLHHFEFQKGVKCEKTFRIAYPSSHKGPYMVKVLLKLHPNYKHIDEYELTVEKYQSTFMELVGGADPNFSIFIEVLGSESKFLTSEQARDEMRDPGDPAFLKRAGISNQRIYCAVIFSEFKHLIVPIESKSFSKAEFPRHFSVAAVVSASTCVGCAGQTIAKFESTGYLTTCPSNYTSKSFPLTYLVLEPDCDHCSVTFTFASADNLDDIKIVYHQDPDTNAPGGTSDSNNNLVLPTIRLQPFSDKIACELVGRQNLNFLRVQEKGITSICYYNDLVKVTKRETLYKKINVVSRVYRAQNFKSKLTPLIASRPVLPVYLEWCSSKWKSREE
ncbi:hypothetical protein RF11_09057 [Thelohanellus kitauei]|uniref:Uncharacterized protein n=1 Tax=Thelohanellus kitauei TaxID=669202 RepID=A0A0C2MTS4_THEKT|nr:hypothetical protein RF11_09057 [Thelohanellus kitauei]